MNAKIMILGAGGRIGRNIVPLLSPEVEWLLADRLSGEIDGRPVQGVDITDYEKTLAAMRGVNAVVHLAIASARKYVKDKPRFLADRGEEYLRYNEAATDVNVRGTYHVFEAAREAGVKRVIYGSSLTVLLGEPRRAKFHDSLPAQPSNFYAVTKLWGEQLGELYSRKHGLTIYCLRFGTPYPLPNHHNWLHLPPGQRSSVTYSDLARAIEVAATAQDGPAFGTYSIVSKAENSIFDCSKAQRELGWRPCEQCEADGSVTVLSYDPSPKTVPVDGMKPGEGALAHR
jgi:uronate dehydrogenase